MGETQLQRTTALILLATAASLPLPTLGAESFQLLRTSQLYCPSEQLAALKTVLDAQGPDEHRTAVEKAIFGGACSVSRFGPIQIANLKQGKTERGRSFSCFQMLSPEDQSELGAYCAPAAAIASLEDEIRTRTGDHRVVSESTFAIKVECVEGGGLMIFKKQGKWERLPLVFPKALDPEVRIVPPDRERALRDGCKGEDYR